MINWEGVITNISSVAVVSTLLIWFGKSVIKHFINRRFAAYELELSYKSDSYKSELEKVLQLHKAQLDVILDRTSRLHEKRLDIIAELYRRIVVLQENMKLMAAKIKTVPVGDNKLYQQQEWDRINNAGLSYNEFYDYYLSNKIFFTENICEILDKIQSEFWDARYDYDFMTKWEDQGTDFRRELFQKTHKQVFEIIPTILKQLEEEFRNDLYVNRNIPIN